MSKKIIFSIECEIPGNLSKFIRYNSKASLLDADIILFRPNISSFMPYSDTYKGKPSLSDSRSFSLRESTEHWRREIKDTFNAGKTTFVILDMLDEVYIDTGERTYSGTGRNTRMTRIVTEYNNYRSLPVDLTFINSNGSSMRLAEKSEIIAGLWSEISEITEYRVLIEGKVSRPIIYTKTGDKIVGAIVTGKTGSGMIVLLPYIDLYNDNFIKKHGEDDNNSDNDDDDDDDDNGNENEVEANGEDDNEDEETNDGKYYWTEKGVTFGHRFVSILVEIDRNLKKDIQVTPTPEWAKTVEYELPKERELHECLLLKESSLEKIQKEKEEIKSRLSDEGLLRYLLYEKGTPLENAIIKALTIVGFRASMYRDSESEFDVVFESEEGRLLGEAEGKDNKAINIDKLRQLEMNIHEDFSREEVTVMAKGVLFGNAYRLNDINNREGFFTEKCLTAAKRNGVALVKTPDLFFATRYLSVNDDQEFARICRLAILNAQGEIVVFPDSPDVSIDQTSEQKDIPD